MSIKKQKGVILVRDIAKYYKVKEEEIIETRKKEIRAARSVLVYTATKYLGESGESIRREARDRNRASEYGKGKRTADL